MSKTFFDNLMAKTENKYAAKASEGMDSDTKVFVDTGCFAFNALLSGSIYGGLSDNKITALAGEESTGKTFYALSLVKDFLNKNKNGAVFYFETESALTTEVLENRGIDTNRFFVIPVVTVEEFRTQCVKIVNEYLSMPVDDRQPLFMVLDSLGMLSTEKETADIAEGKNTRDMTRAQVIKGTFRVLSLKLGRAHVPLLVINHVYDVVGAYVPTQEMSGGSGLKYAASQIIFLKKKKFKDSTTNEVIGNVIVAKVAKSRLTVENKTVDTLLDYSTGLDRYYGLLPVAEKHGIIKKIANKFEFPGGIKAFEKAIVNNPEVYWTKEVLDLVDAACQKEFLYGNSNTPVVEAEDAE